MIDLLVFGLGMWIGLVLWFFIPIFVIASMVSIVNLLKKSSEI